MLRVLFGLNGRIGRRNYWLAIVSQWAILAGMFFAFSTAIMGLFAMIGIDINSKPDEAALESMSTSDAILASGIGIATIVFLFLVIGMSIYMSIAAQAKRLHDMNMSGWLTMINFAAVPVATTLTMSDPANGPIALFIMLLPAGLGLACGFFPGTVGANQYGEDRISIFDTNARTDETWADRAEAHRNALKEAKEAHNSNAEAEATPKRERGRTSQRGGGSKKGFGKRGMA